MPSKNTQKIKDSINSLTVYIGLIENTLQGLRQQLLSLAKELEIRDYPAKGKKAEREARRAKFTEMLLTKPVKKKKA